MAETDVPRDFRAEIDALDDRPADPSSASPVMGQEPAQRPALSPEMESLVQHETLRQTIDKDRDRLEAVAKSRGHMGAMGESWGILPENPEDAGAFEKIGNLLFGTARTKKEWASNEGKDLDTARERVRKVEDSTVSRHYLTWGA